jgi:Co/Zn/Cd efflux system component
LKLKISFGRVKKMSDCDCSVEVESREQSRLLWVLLLINGVMFVVEIGIGILAESMGLIADSLDMLADAAVYGIGLYAVRRSDAIKITAATISGFFQVFLGIGLLAEIVRRFIFGSDPEPLLMIGIGVLALIANVVCLALISKHRDGEIHMRASWVFSKNDVIANSGVIFTGLMVYVLDSRLPDLLIGSIIVLVVLTGGLKIIGDARSERKEPTLG